MTIFADSLDARIARLRGVVSVMAVASAATLALMIIVSALYRSVPPGPVGYALVLIGTVASIGLLLLARQRVYRAADQLANVLASQSATAWLCAAIGFGIALRVAFWALYPTPLYSDELAYSEIARLIANGDAVSSPAGPRYWPPGHSMILSYLYLLGAGPRTASLILNCAAFVVAISALFLISRRAFGKSAAVASAILFAVWPNLIALTSLPTKEVLESALIIVAALGAVLAARECVPSSRSLAYACLSGAVLGLSALAQPSTLLLSGVITIYFALSRTPFSSAVTHSIAMILCMFLVIAPWTLRNTSIDESFVLISSNGGGNFLSANNPNATGGWMEIDPQYMTDRADAKAYQLGIDWVRTHPAQFVKLIPIKITRLLADDDYGAFRTFEHPAVIARSTPAERTFYRLVSDGYWYLLAALVFLAAIHLFEQRDRQWPEVTLFVGLAFYFVLIHSVFQSEAKHHINVAPVFAILAGSLLLGTRRLNSENNAA